MKILMSNKVTKLYLDNAATTPVHPRVYKVMQSYFMGLYYNPSSLYSKARQVRYDIDRARNTIAQFINADKDEIYFTSGGSESNCWAIQGFAKAHDSVPTIVIKSAIEHHSINACCEDESSIHNITVETISVDDKGFVNITELENKIISWQDQTQNTLPILVTIQLANNEIGTIQNIKEIAKIVHWHGAYIHCDATQAFGHIPIDVKDLGIDMMTASGHKIQAPKGIGFLYIKESVEIKPLIYGTQENGMRGGTENVPYIIGFAEAVRLRKAEMQTNYTNQLKVRNYLWQQLRDRFGCTLNGSDTNRLDNNINVTFPQNITGEALIYLLDSAGYYISAGSACNSQTNQPSHVLRAIGLTERDALRTIRITLPESSASVDIRIQAIDEFLNEVEKCLKILTVE